jgi:hypothetical protein
MVAKNESGRAIEFGGSVVREKFTGKESSREVMRSGIYTRGSVYRIFSAAYGRMSNGISSEGEWRGPKRCLSPRSQRGAIRAVAEGDHRSTVQSCTNWRDTEGMAGEMGDGPDKEDRDRPDTVDPLVLEQQLAGC